MTTTLAPVTVAHRVSRRASTVLGAVVATSVLQVGASALGVDFLLSDEMGSAVLTLPVVAIATAIFGLLGWGSLALLERTTRRARGIWTALALTVTVASLVPIFLEHATAGTRVTLVLVHLAVAAVLVPLLRRGSRAA